MWILSGEILTIMFLLNCHTPAGGHGRDVGGSGAVLLTCPLEDFLESRTSL